METTNSKETKRTSKLLKLAKIDESTYQPQDNYEPPRRSKQKQNVNEDSSTFNGLEYFEKQRKQVKTSSPQQTIEHIIAQDSLRQRFENLHNITSIDKMLMHTKYQTLCQYFKEIDEMILFLKNSQKPPFLSTISQQLSQNSKIAVTQQVIQQMLSIYPEAYQVCWGINEKLIRLDRSDLKISADIKSHITLSERLKCFKEKLFQYIQTNGEQIMLAQLPENTFTPIKNYNNGDNNIKEKLVQKIQEIPKTHEIKSNISKEPTLSKVSQLLIERLKQKKQIEIIHTEQQAPKKQLIALSSLLHQYYINRDVSNMFLQNVIKYSLNSLKQYLTDENQIKKFITQLIELCPHWIKIIENPNGQLLRMDREIDLPSIIRNIENM